MRKRILSVFAVLLLSFAIVAAPLAYAAEAVPVDTTKADVDVEEVTISADEDDLTAVIEGCAFAVGDFQRASK